MPYELPAYNEENWHIKLNASIEAVKQLAEQNAGPLPSDIGDVMVARYDNGWPARPTSDVTKTVIWLGGTPSTPPTAHVTGVDLWYVPNPQ